MASSAVLSLPASVDDLDKFFLTKSYVSGYAYSNEDKKVFDTVKECPSAKNTPNAFRWYTHIKKLIEDFAPVVAETSSAPAKSEEKADDDIDLFGSDDEEEVEKLRQKRVEEAQKKKKGSGKGDVVAKSLVVLDVKPWDDTTDMDKLKAAVRAIQMDGLLWGTDKFALVGYGIRKLEIACVVEDEKVSVDELCEKIEEIGDYVQSVDIVSFNKI